MAAHYRPTRKVGRFDIHASWFGRGEYAIYVAGLPNAFKRFDARVRDVGIIDAKLVAVTEKQIEDYCHERIAVERKTIANAQKQIEKFQAILDGKEAL